MSCNIRLRSRSASATGLQERRRASSCAWLLAIQWVRVRRVLRQYLQTQRNAIAREVPIDDVGASSIQEPGTSPPSRDDQRSRLADAIARLPEEQRRLLRWRYNDGLTFSQIGERLGLKEDAARMQVARLVAEVRRCMGEDDAD